MRFPNLSTLIAGLLLLALPLTARAGDEQLVAYSHDPGTDMYSLINVVTDDAGSIAALRIQCAPAGWQPGDSVPTQANGVSNSYSLASLSSEADIAVYDASGKLYKGLLKIRLSGSKELAKRGGEVRIRWNTNVPKSWLLGDRAFKQTSFELSRDDSGQWHLYSGGRIVKTLDVSAGKVGLDTIVPKFAELSAPVAGSTVVEEELASAKQVPASRPDVENREHCVKKDAFKPVSSTRAAG